MRMRLGYRFCSTPSNGRRRREPHRTAAMVAGVLFLLGAILFPQAAMEAKELTFQEVRVPTVLNRTVRLRLALEPEGGPWKPQGDGTTFENELYELRLPAKSLDPEVVALDVVLRRKDGQQFTLLRCESSVTVDAARLQTIWPSSRMGANTDLDFLGTLGSVAQSHASSHDPVLMALEGNGTNLCTFGMAWTAPETLIRWSPTVGLEPWKREYSLSFSRPMLDGVPLVTREYRDGIFLSLHAESWYAAMRRYAAFVDQWRGYQPRPASPHALAPCWSVGWTTFPEGQPRDKGDMQKIIESQLPLAQELGFGSVHVDIDWSPDGYYRPDPERFPDFSGMMKKLREAGMVLEVHVSTPNLVQQAPSFERLKPSIMTTKTNPKGSDEWGRYCLCPRTEGMRDHLVESVQYMVRDLGIKSIWVDFNDLGIYFEPCQAPHAHAWSTNGEGWDAQMKAFATAAWAMDPEVAIIARRSTANVHNKPYLTHGCAPDCEYGQAQQRREAIFIRSCGPGMIPYTFHGVWADSEPETEVAQHMASYVLLTVPVVCQDLSRLPAGHLDVIRAWLKFYREHAADIVYGDLEPLVPMRPSAAFRIERNQHALVGCFETVPGTIPLTSHPSEIFLFNGVANDFSTSLTGVEGKFRGQWLDHQLRPYGAPFQIAAENGRMLVHAECPQLPCLLRLTQVR